MIQLLAVSKRLPKGHRGTFRYCVIKSQVHLTTIARHEFFPRNQGTNQTKSFFGINVASCFFNGQTSDHASCLFEEKRHQEFGYAWHLLKKGALEGQNPFVMMYESKLQRGLGMQGTSAPTEPKRHRGSRAEGKYVLHTVPTKHRNEKRQEFL
eukprot:5136151-Amphidinium_carterae.1